MFEDDKSAARANMRPCARIAFKHESKVGNARADQLFERVQIELKEILRHEKRPPRTFSDYELRIVDADLPAGITVEHWL